MVRKIVLVILVAVTAQAAAHHSEAGLDIETVLTLDGVVTEYEWRNPHIYFSIDTTADDGESASWTVQMSSTVSMMSRGWSRDTLTVGDRITVAVNPARDGRRYAVLDELVDVNGVDAQTVLARGSSAGSAEIPVAARRATSIEGRWLTDPSRLGDYPGGLDELTSERLVLTDAARSAQAAFDENTAENPELYCLGRPAPAMLIYHNYPIEIEFGETDDVIYLRGQYMDQERVVDMRASTHPPGTEQFHEGHSIGRWEGDVLIVDTTNFTPHPAPYQNDIPSSAQKHVVERYRVADDGQRLVVELMLEDPEFLAEPFHYRRELLYSPDVDMSPFDCSLESTQRYRPQ